MFGVLLSETNKSVVSTVKLVSTWASFQAKVKLAENSRNVFKCLKLSHTYLTQPESIVKKWFQGFSKKNTIKCPKKISYGNISEILKQVSMTII